MKFSNKLSIWEIIMIVLVGLAGVFVILERLFPIGPSVSQARKALEERLIEEDGKLFTLSRYPNGQLETRNEYTRNDKGIPVSHGTHTHWNRDGTVLLRRLYRRGRQVPPGTPLE